MFDALVNPAVVMAILIRTSLVIVTRESSSGNDLDQLERLFLPELRDTVCAVPEIPTAFIVRSACPVIGVMPYRILNVTVSVLSHFFLLAVARRLHFSCSLQLSPERNATLQR